MLAKAYTIAIAGLLLALLAVVSPQTAARQFDTEERLLEQIESDARQVRSHADSMRSLVRFPMDFHWKTHAFELTQIRERVNDIGENLLELKSIANNDPELRQVSDTLTPMQVELVRNTEEAIEFVQKQNLANFADRTYASNIDGMYHSADQIARSVEEFLE